MTDAPRQPPPSPTHAVPSSSATHPAVSLTTQPPALPKLSPCHVASAHVRSPFHLFLSCSINLSVQPDAGRASCIPNTKNNHFSVTGVVVVVVGMVVPGRGAGMDGGGCGGVGRGRGRGKLPQLAGTRFNCSYSTRGGVMGKRWGHGGGAFYIFVKTRNTQNVERVPRRIRKANFLCSCWGRTAQII